MKEISNVRQRDAGAKEHHVMKTISNAHQRNAGAKEHHVMKTISNAHQRDAGAKEQITHSYADSVALLTLIIAFIIKECMHYARECNRKCVAIWINEQHI